MHISIGRLMAGAFAAAILAAPMAASAAEPSPTAPAGHIGGVIPVHGQGHTSSGSKTGTNNLSYHGGPVMTTNTVYAIYWAPAGYSISTSYQGSVDQFLTDVAAATSTGNTKNVYGVDTQYSGINFTGARFGGAYLDTASAFQKACSDTDTPSMCLSDGEIQAEVQRAVAASTWAVNSTTLFAVFTPPNVGSCSSSSSCAFTQYCAYHGDFSANGQTYYYANMPFVDTVPSACGTGQAPYGDPDAAAEVNVLSHEHNEIITDEALNAWYDRQGYENGDKCAWNFGTVSGGNGAEYNQTINGHNYYLQQEWSNAIGACALSR